MAQSADRERDPIMPLPLPLEARQAVRPSLAVVIPVYNEEQVLQRTYDALSKRLETLDVRWSVLFVNDGSSDHTAAVLETLFRHDSRVSYILLSRNFGHQAALTAGLDHVDADVVVTMDGDLQHPPELLVDLLCAWRAGYDIVHTKKVSTAGLSWYRRVATGLAYRIVTKVAQVSIIPHASDYRLFDRVALAAIRTLPERGRLYRGLAAWVGFRQCVVPFAASARSAGTSHYGLRQLGTLFMRSLFDYSDVPLYIGLVLGTIAVAISMLYAGFIAVWFLVGEGTPPGWVSSVSVTLALNSVVLFFCGIIGIYVARIYSQVRTRPSYMLSRVRRHEDPGSPMDAAHD
jgi:dolichol-phosphate mannosyltransferase